MRHIFVFSQVKNVRLPRKKMAQLGEVILKGEKRNLDVNIVFIDDAKMRSVNRSFRGKNKTTDVLSFNLNGDADSFLGEIYISLPEAARNAETAGHSREEEILRLLCHGMLHLCGVHHPNATARQFMAAKEDHYLQTLKSRVAG